jgi:hypothetical protein
LKSRNSTLAVWSDGHLNYAALLHCGRFENSTTCGDATLLIGSSFSEKGIGPDAFAEALAHSGRAATVQHLAVGGSPHLERLHYLKEYLARAKRRPQLVPFEIAGGYDSGPLYQVHQMRFSDRMVAMMDGLGAAWCCGPTRAKSVEPIIAGSLTFVGRRRVEPRHPRALCAADR